MESKTEQEDDQITDEQRQRAEANRLAALAKRKARLTGPAAAGDQNPWKLFKCRKLYQELNVHSSNNFSVPKQPSLVINPKPEAQPAPPLPEKFRARLEICSPDSFSITPEAIKGFPYPGDARCFEILGDCLSTVIPSHYTQNHGGGKACVYKLRDYEMVLRSLKNSKSIDYEEIPWGTFNVVERLSHCFTSGRWVPCRPEHLPDEKVEELMANLPEKLRDALLPFQLEGVRFGLRRGGRCLIADEMGLGKTLQAIAIASCFMNDGPILVVCPAILRYSWAEELERWLPFCLPSDIHLVFGHQNNPAHLTRCPKVVVISYTMLKRLRKSMLERNWVSLIVDESHHLRCTKKKAESEELKAVLDVGMKVKHIILLSGTPSLSRPYDIFHQINMLWQGMLGKTKYEYAKTYCSVNYLQGCQGKVYQDFSKGIRLEELNVLLKQTVMIRRLKEHVLTQLPPKRRQIIRLDLRKSDIASAMAIEGMVTDHASENQGAEDGNLEDPDNADDNVGSCQSSKKLSVQAVGIAKVSGFCEWLSLHPIMQELDSEETMEARLNSHKMIIFAHHHKVFNGVQEFLCEKGVDFIRIDCNTSASDRQKAIKSFQSSAEVKIALIGILAGGSGLNLSSAQSVVFLELPKEPANMLQAEDRAHRQGQTKAVNIYIFCAKDTSDEVQWQKLNRSLRRVSSTVNGKYDAVHEIEVDSVSLFETDVVTDGRREHVMAESVGIGKVSEANKISILERKTSQEIFAVKQINLHTSLYDEDGQPLEACHEPSIMLNKSDGEQNDNGAVSCQVSNLHFENTVSNLQYKESATKDNAETAEGISLCKLGEDNENKDHLEKGHNKFLSTEVNDGGSSEHGQTGADSCIQVNSLRFEVSQYTGRVHLYLCIPGVDARPRPIFQNFRPEEVEALEPFPEDSKNMNYRSIKDDPRYRCALMDFINEWDKLRPIEKRKLFGKPLQVPLSTELCYLSESLNHDNGGLLKRGSKRRVTPLDEITYPLPSNAVWKRVHICSGCGKKDKIYTQGWSTTDVPLCKLCQSPCMHNNAKTPEFFEDLFCNLDCYEEYRLRTSNRCVREALFQIEHGICTNCHLNCHQLVEHIRPLSMEKRQEYIKKAAPNIAKCEKLLARLVRSPIEGNAWHADHIIPVYRGGGECRLENMRTLCVACHADVTAAQCADRRLTRIRAKKQLKVIMSNLKDAEKHEPVDATDHQQSEMPENVAEDELLVQVPGSAYSGARISSSDSQEREMNSRSSEPSHCKDDAR